MRNEKRTNVQNFLINDKFESGTTHPSLVLPPLSKRARYSKKNYRNEEWLPLEKLHSYKIVKEGSRSVKMPVTKQISKLDCIWRKTDRKKGSLKMTKRTSSSLSAHKTAFLLKGQLLKSCWGLLSFKKWRFHQAILSTSVVQLISTVYVQIKIRNNISQRVLLPRMYYC